MYHIIESENGQPIILWNNGNMLHKYIINSGRIINKGVLLKDINNDFTVWKEASNYISYKSVDSSTVICNLTNDSTNEVYTTHHTSCVIDFQNNLLVFQLSPNNDIYELNVTSSVNFNDTITISNNLEFSEEISAIKYMDMIVILLKNQILFVSSDFKVISTLNISPESDLNINNLQNEVSKLKFELHQLEQDHDSFLKEYDKLSTYAGELQEKLRKTRLNINP